MATSEPPSRHDSLTAQLVGTQALLTAGRLLTLDELWTGQLETVTEPAERRELSEPLGQVVADMQDGLDSIVVLAASVGRIMSSLTDDDFDSALRSLGETAPVLASVDDELRASLEGLTPRLAAIAACNYVSQNAPAERTLLQEQLDRLERGEAGAGDFRFPFTCGLMLVCVGAGVVAAIGFGGPVGFVALAVASQVGMGALGWVSAKCPKTLSELKDAPPPQTPLPS